MITNLLKRRVVSDAAVFRVSQLACFGAACMIPVLVIRKLSQLDLSEAQLLIGVPGTMSLALLCTVVGLCLENLRKTT